MVSMVFWKQGRVLTKYNSMSFEGKRLAVVNFCRYLGIILQMSKVTYTNHMKEKALLVITAMN
jgi:hypothetical protein